uniref:Predicted protein n=1 Tax=Hordeum vulgare subsp. vulgare TaxID=112509 RepID=F2DV54_HORVV|nr:predicted protein [Hordeum vulgare subsp. vulgare]
MRVSGGMFTPRHAPLKEGRSLPGLPYGGPTRRSLRSRQGALLIIVLLCVPLIYFLHSTNSLPTAPPPSDSSLNYRHDGSSSNSEGVRQSGPNGIHQQADFPQSHIGLEPANEHLAADNPFAAPPKEAPFAKPKKPAVTNEYDGEPTPLRDSDRTSKPKIIPADVSGKESQSSIGFAERPKFEKALARVLALLPGEMEGRDLLRQVEGTGKEKLREMGLRVREYKKFFEAWEALHLSFDEEGGSYVRDDVIQYLRHHNHQPPEEMTGAELASTIHSYEAYRYFLVKFGQMLFPWTAPYFPDHMTLHSHFKKGGRGIVLTAGDDQAPFLLTTIPTFRKLGCDLPIEVMYLGDSDLSEDYRQELEDLDGVITRDIAQMVNDEGWKLAGWAAKPFAILFSSFREVIFIDADSLFFVNPEVLFEDPAYQKTGALFFKDRLIMPENKKRWLQQILPKPISRQVKQSRFWTGDSGHMQESGVVVVDKWRHFVALLLVTRMNGPDRDGNKDEGRVGVYDMVYGDKETFWIGWELVGDLDYAFHQGDAGIMGTVQTHELSEEEKAEKARKKKNKNKPFDGEVPREGEPSEPAAPEPEEEEAEPIDEEPSTYSICAPQLLHLDYEGKPLWFNGWLLDNKFADKKQKKFGKFEHYLIEPRDVRDPGAWQLEESNMCCLTTDAPLKRDFSPEERSILAMMIQQAKDVGVPG